MWFKKFFQIWIQHSKKTSGHLTWWYWWKRKIPFFPPPPPPRGCNPKDYSRFEFSTSKNLPLDISHDDLGGINKNPFFPSPPLWCPHGGVIQKIIPDLNSAPQKILGVKRYAQTNNYHDHTPPPSPPTWALRLIKFHLEAIFDIRDPKNLGIGIHRATSWYFIIGLLFEAKKAVIQPLWAQGPILRPLSKSETQKTYNLIFIKLYMNLSILASVWRLKKPLYGLREVNIHNILK